MYNSYFSVMSSDLCGSKFVCKYAYHMCHLYSQKTFPVAHMLFILNLRNHGFI